VWIFRAAEAAGVGTNGWAEARAKVEVPALRAHRSKLPARELFQPDLGISPAVGAATGNSAAFSRPAGGFRHRKRACQSLAVAGLSRRVFGLSVTWFTDGRRHDS